MIRCCGQWHILHLSMEKLIGWRANNEYWLEQDARLREDFNIGNGFRPCDIAQIKSKYK